MPQISQDFRRNVARPSSLNHAPLSEMWLTGLIPSPPSRHMSHEVDHKKADCVEPRGDSSMNLNVRGRETDARPGAEMFPRLAMDDCRIIGIGRVDVRSLES